MKISDETVRSEWRTNAAPYPVILWWMDMAELWAEAMEPYLDAGVPISTAAPATFNEVMPQTGRDTIGVLSRGHDFMVDYLNECWAYGEKLGRWYTILRSTRG